MRRDEPREALRVELGTGIAPELGMTRDFPRILIVTNTAINDRDAHGAFLRNYFREWPKPCLAETFQEITADSPPFTPTRYQLGRNDRRFGAVYAALKQSPVGTAARRAMTAESLTRPSMVRVRCVSCANAVSKQLLKSGAWEWLFAPKPSEEFLHWIDAFQPQIVYTQGYSLFYLWLPMLISRRFNTPLCIHFLDDWPLTLYRNTPLSFVVRRLAARVIDSAIRHATVRITIGDDMASEYRSRYAVDFVPMMNCDDSERFRNAVPTRLQPDGIRSVVYSGSLGLGRWKALVSLSVAANMLKRDGISIRISAYVPAVPPEAVTQLVNLDNVEIREAPNDRDVPSLLKGADVLFLPESFDRVWRDEIRLSIATKAHLYMMAGRPALVWGPPWAGVIRYAKREGWGLVEEQNDVRRLAHALRRLLSESDLRSAVVARGLAVAERYHEGKTVREGFRATIASAAGLES